MWTIRLTPAARQGLQQFDEPMRWEFIEQINRLANALEEQTRRPRLGEIAYRVFEYDSSVVDDVRVVVYLDALSHRENELAITAVVSVGRQADPPLPDD